MKETTYDLMATIEEIERRKKVLLDLGFEINMIGLVYLGSEIHITDTQLRSYSKEVFNAMVETLKTKIPEIKENLAEDKSILREYLNSIELRHTPKFKTKSGEKVFAYLEQTFDEFKDQAKRQIERM